MDRSRFLTYHFPALASALLLASTCPAAVPARGDAAEQRGIWSGMTASIPQYGTIGGIPFARVYYKGIYENHAARTFRALRGLEYICIDQKNCVHLIAEDTQDEGETTLPLAEAAVLTFTRS